MLLQNKQKILNQYTQCIHILNKLNKQYHQNQNQKQIQNQIQNQIDQIKNYNYEKFMQSYILLDINYLNRLNSDIDYNDIQLFKYHYKQIQCHQDPYSLLKQLYHKDQTLFGSQSEKQYIQIIKQNQQNSAFKQRLIEQYKESCRQNLNQKLIILTKHQNSTLVKVFNVSTDNQINTDNIRINHQVSKLNAQQIGEQETMDKHKRYGPNNTEKLQFGQENFNNIYCLQNCIEFFLSLPQRNLQIHGINIKESSNYSNKQNDHIELNEQIISKLRLVLLKKMFNQTLESIYECHKINLTINKLSLCNIVYSLVDQRFKLSIRSLKTAEIRQIRQINQIQANISMSLNKQPQKLQKYIQQSKSIQQEKRINEKQNHLIKNILKLIQNYKKTKNQQKYFYNLKNKDYFVYFKFIFRIMFRIQISQNSQQRYAQKHVSQQQITDLFINQILSKILLIDFSGQNSIDHAKYQIALRKFYDNKNHFSYNKNGFSDLQQSQKQQFINKIQQLFQKIIIKENEEEIFSAMKQFYYYYLNLRDIYSSQKIKGNQNSSEQISESENLSQVQGQSKIQSTQNWQLTRSLIQKSKPIEPSAQISQPNSHTLLNNQSNSKQSKLLQQLNNSLPKRFLDHFTFEQKKILFLNLCKIQMNYSKIRSPSIKLKKHYQYQVFYLLSQKNILLEILEDLSLTSIGINYSLTSRIILLLLMYQPKDTNRERKTSLIVQNKLKEFRNILDHGKNLSQQLQKNRQLFWFDNQLDEKSNFIIFKITVFYLLNQALTIQMESIFKMIFKESIQFEFMNILNEKQQQQYNEETVNKQQNQQNLKIDQFFKNQNEIIQQKDSNPIPQSNQIGQKMHSQKQHKLIRFKDLSFKQKYQIVQKLNNNHEFQGFFILQNSHLALKIPYRQNKSQQIQLFNKILQINCPFIQELSVVRIQIESLGLLKICTKWTNLKILYIWSCKIKTLEGSKLQLLKQLEVLSLSNNLLQKDSVEYLLKHKWQSLIELRISFRDGSDSYDMLFPHLKMVFPKLVNLFIRQLMNISYKTLKDMLNIRMLGVFVFFRLEKQIMRELLNSQYQTVDFQGQNDRSYFEKVHQQIQKQQLAIIKNQQNIIQNQQKILQANNCKNKILKD